MNTEMPTESQFAQVVRSLAEEGQVGEARLLSNHLAIQKTAVGIELHFYGYLSGTIKVRDTVTFEFMQGVGDYTKRMLSDNVLPSLGVTA
jgi:hypothetical protein